MAAREAERTQNMAEFLPEEVAPDPLYQDDDDDFWQLHELDYPRDAQVFSGTVDCTGEDVANDDELVGRLAPREREALLMREMHGVALQEVALALGIPPTEVKRLLDNARRHVRGAGKAPH